MSEPQRFDVDTTSAAHKQQYSAIQHGTEFFAKLAFLGAAIKTAAPKIPGVATITAGLTSFHLEGAGRLQTPRPTIFVVLYLAPAPIGVLPPEWHGLPPNWLQPVLPEWLQFEAIAGAASPERLESYALQQRRDAIGKRVDRFVLFGKGEYANDELLSDLAFLRSLPDNFESMVFGRPSAVVYSEHIENILRERGIEASYDTEKHAIILQAVSGVVSPLPALDVPAPAPVAAAPTIPNPEPKTVGTFDPASVKPIALAAMGAKKAFDLVKDMLIHERADP